MSFVISVLTLWDPGLGPTQDQFRCSSQEISQQQWGNGGCRGLMLKMLEVECGEGVGKDENLIDLEMYCFQLETLTMVPT